MKGPANNTTSSLPLSGSSRKWSRGNKVAQVANLASRRAIAARKSATAAKEGKGSNDLTVFVWNGRSSVIRRAILDRNVNQWRLRQRLHVALQLTSVGPKERVKFDIYCGKYHLDDSSTFVIPEDLGTTQLRKKFIY